ncbi:MAG: hypothetical protein QNJ17_14975, partial [Desulfocapsaceae bacterium]|nr:hypothetical protein [Desulfocapsaceae bacterium]
QDHRIVSWNGISLEIPRSWEAQVISLQHLSFESDTKAVLELRWQEANEKNIQRFISTLTKQYQELNGVELISVDPPPEGKELLKNFKVTCYTASRQSLPNLVFLHDKSERFFLMLQFHAIRKDEHPLKIIRAIGQSTTKDGLMSWSIQDFQALIPNEFKLIKYTMKAGLTVLEFACGKAVMHLCRLSVAAQRLEKQNLAEIFTSLLGFEKAHSLDYISENTVRYVAQPGILRQIGIRVQRKKPFQLATFWHDKANDRLLGCFMQGIAPIDPQLHTTICENYEIVSINQD